MNATPVPERAPRLPNTMACTLTAVPPRFVMPWILRYLTARSLSHEPNTAAIDRSSCSHGSSGNACPVWALYASRYFAITPSRAASSSPVSRSVPASRLAAASTSSNASWSTPATTSPNIWMKRRRASSANRRLPDSFASPSTHAAESPRLRTVSIIPGIDTAAPERTDTSSGRSARPNPRPSSFSSRAIALRAPAMTSAGTFPPDA